jgi:hypothetical protein
MMDESEEARILARTEIKDPSGCWIWKGRKNGGYGRMVSKGKNKYVYRFVYEHVVGKVPEGLELDHEVCSNKACINPLHLTPVTHRENVLRGVSPAAQHAKKTHCPQGHEYSGSNLYIMPNGGRVCRTCTREANNKSRWDRGINRKGWSRKLITNCPRGHEYTADNTYEHNGKRSCKQCNVINQRAYVLRRKRAANGD